MHAQVQRGPGLAGPATTAMQDPGLVLLFLAGDELQRDGVDAEALVSGRSVALALEHVAQVRIAGGAADLDPLHAQGPVVDVADGALRQRGPEGRPAAVRIELLVAGEQLGAAGPALVHARRVGVPVLAGVRAARYRPGAARGTPRASVPAATRRRTFRCCRPAVGPRAAGPAGRRSRWPCCRKCLFPKMLMACSTLRSRR